MKILFDQGTPVPLRKYLAGHAVETAFERGWSTKVNGDLLSAAESAGFECLVTTDQNLKYQQNLPSRKIAIVVLMTTSWPKIRAHVHIVQNELSRDMAGAYIEVVFPTA